MSPMSAAVALALFLQPQAAPPLRIVVVAGEDAVNIVQQKSAAAPLVEIRDRNNLPVAGATVTFTIGSGQPAAFAGGVQTLTVTTNAAGQAAASGFSALAPGAVQVQVQAAFQGQIATAAISQTNVATAAAAAQAGATGGAGGSTSGAAGGAAGGGGGGMSVTTIGIIGAAAAGGVVAARQTGLLGGGHSRSASFSGDIVVTTVTTSIGGSTTCVSTRAVSGSVKIDLDDNDASGSFELDGTVRETGVTGSALCSPLGNGQGVDYRGSVSGGPNNLTFTAQSSHTGTTPATVTATDTWLFAGAVSGDAITGTLTYTHGTRGTGANQSVITGNGSATFPVTLR